jgi:hypothetical protein
MDTSKLLGQVIIVLVGIIMAVALAFFLLDQFIYPRQMENLQPPVATISDNSITGMISKITVDETVVGQKALVTIATLSGEIKKVSLPADSRTECVARTRVTVADLQIGATVIVSGTETAAGTIEPCAQASDDFKIKTL